MARTRGSIIHVRVCVCDCVQVKSHRKHNNIADVAVFIFPPTGQHPRE